MTNEQRNQAELDQYKMYTLTEIEPILGVSHHTLLMWIKNGKLPATRICRGKWKVSKATLDQFLTDTATTKAANQISVNDNGRLQVADTELTSGDAITVLVWNGNTAEWINTTVECRNGTYYLTGIDGCNPVGLFARV